MNTCSTHKREFVTEEDIRTFYKERYGIDINSCKDLVSRSLVNLYYKGRFMSAQTLYDKLTLCGEKVTLRRVVRTRMKALSARVAAEPPHLSDFGGLMWHLLEARPFDSAELHFLVKYCPEVMEERYPALLRLYLSSRNTGSSNSDSDRKATAIRQPRSAAPHTR